jgi:hypothetical protein
MGENLGQYCTPENLIEDRGGWKDFRHPHRQKRTISAKNSDLEVEDWLRTLRGEPAIWSKEQLSERGSTIL